MYELNLYFRSFYCSERFIEFLKGVEKKNTLKINEIEVYGKDFTYMSDAAIGLLKTSRWAAHSFSH